MLIYLITFNNRIPVTMARTCWAPGILFACGIRLQTPDLADISPATPYVFVSNHQSYLDIPILFRTLPHNLYFVAKKELKRIPFLGWYMAATGMIFIDRSDSRKSASSLKDAAALIKNGKSVLMFPEGTRVNSTTLGTFKRGPFILAHQAQTEVTPVGIDYSGKPYCFKRFGTTKVFVKAGPPVLITEKPDGSTVKTMRQHIAVLSGKLAS